MHFDGKAARWHAAPRGAAARKGSPQTKRQDEIYHELCQKEMREEEEERE